MRTVRYVGRYDAVELPLGDFLGSSVIVAQGEAVEVEDGLAASLLEQPGNWEPVDPPTPPKRETAAAEKETEL